MGDDAGLAIHFEPEGHRYTTPDGRRLPGITEILAAQGLSELPPISAARLDQARQRGTYVHDLVRFYDERRLDLGHVDAALEPYLFGWQRFCADADVTLLEIEQPRVHPEFGFCGTPDRVALVRGALAVLEVKSTAFDEAHAIQTAAQKILVERGRAEAVERRLVVVLRPDGEYKLHDCTAAMDTRQFLAALANYLWRCRHGRTVNGGTR